MLIEEPKILLFLKS